LPETVSAVQAGIERGLHTGLQIYVSLHGEVVADGGIGEARPSEPMTSDAMLPWLSAGKPLTSVAILQLVERGMLELDSPVADVIPGFGTGGKEAITPWHLLTHTAGIRTVDTGWPDATWNETLRRISEMPLEDGWIIGETAGYHVASSWFVLGELVRRIDGRPFPAYLRDEICAPLHLNDTWNGMPESVWAEYGPRISPMWQQDRGTTSLLSWHDAKHCAASSPGGNTRGPVRELGRIYECLLAGGTLDGQHLLSTSLVELLTDRHRVGKFDLTLQHTVDFGLGVIVDSNRYGTATVPYGFSPFCSEQAFGHGGSQCSTGFADPAHQLVVCYVANSRIGEPRHQKRHRELVTAIYSDLGLAQ